MNYSIMRSMGFDIVKIKKLVKQGKCVLCERKVEKAEFRDKISEKEYLISGTCQSCQDDTFQEGA